MISDGTAVILALTVNRKASGHMNEDFRPFMTNDESKWLLKYWLLTCCFQVQGINTKSDPFGLSITHNANVAKALGVTVPDNQYPFLPSRFGGRLPAVWLEKLAISSKDDHEELLCEYACRCFNAAVGNCTDDKAMRKSWLARLMGMIDAAALDK